MQFSQQKPYGFNWLSPDWLVDFSNGWPVSFMVNQMGRGTSYA